MSLGTFALTTRHSTTLRSWHLLRRQTAAAESILVACRIEATELVPLVFIVFKSIVVRVVPRIAPTEIMRGYIYHEVVTSRRHNIKHN
jgi:hypothetical protein